MRPGGSNSETTMKPNRLTTAEELRLTQDTAREKNWKRWGPYLSERQWATVREDYSACGKLLGLLPPRSCAQPRVSLGRGRPAGHHRSAVPALLCVGALEQQRPDLERAALRADGLRGQPRRGREGMLLLPRFDPDAFLHEGALQIPLRRTRELGIYRQRYCGCRYSLPSSGRT